MPSDPKTLFVGVNECERKHKASGKLITVILSLFCLVFILLGWALFSSSLASDKAEISRDELHIHAAEQNGSLKAIDGRLCNIESHQKDLKVDMREQRVLIRTLIKEVASQ